MISREQNLEVISRRFLLISIDSQKYHEIEKWNRYIQAGLMNLVTLQKYHQRGILQLKVIELE